VADYCTEFGIPRKAEFNGKFYDLRYFTPKDLGLLIEDFAKRNKGAKKLEPNEVIQKVLFEEIEMIPRVILYALQLSNDIPEEKLKLIVNNMNFSWELWELCYWILQGKDYNKNENVNWTTLRVSIKKFFDIDIATCSMSQIEELLDMLPKKEPAKDSAGMAQEVVESLGG
jgi:hypothetical protein